MPDHHPERQSPIDAHGIIGDMRSAALVNDKGSVDFFCWPEFDSPSIFCSLLDTPDAGIFQLSRICPTRVASRFTCRHQRAANPLAQ
jgi:GH15 family glucan-1,4-alpha-glucosidase